MIQRWIVTHDGRLARNAAIDPAETAMSTLIVTLITICSEPSTNDCDSTLPVRAFTNCGRSDKHSTAAFKRKSRGRARLRKTKGDNGIHSLWICPISERILLRNASSASIMSAILSRAYIAVV